MRQYDQAIERYRKALELDPHFPLAIYCLALSYGQKAMFAEAIDMLSVGKDFRATRGYLYAVSGRRLEAQKMLNGILSDSKEQPSSPYLIAKVYAGMGERDKAFLSLQEAYEIHDERMVMLKVAQHLDSLRSDPRFSDLLRRVGL